MLFKVENRRDKRSTHCGVLEFIADEGMVYMPYWVRPPRLPRPPAAAACKCCGRQPWLAAGRFVHSLVLPPWIHQPSLASLTLTTPPRAAHDARR
jgi:hypothetical protein